MCGVLQITPSIYYEHQAIARDPERVSVLAKLDAALHCAAKCCVFGKTNDHSAVPSSCGMRRNKSSLISQAAEIPAKHFPVKPGGIRVHPCLQYNNYWGKSNFSNKGLRVPDMRNRQCVVRKYRHRPVRFQIGMERGLFMHDKATTRRHLRQKIRYQLSG